MPFGLLVNGYMTKRDKEKANADPTTATPIIDRENQIKALLLKYKQKVISGALFAAWVVFFLAVWSVAPLSYVPSPWAVLKMFPDVWSEQGLGDQMIVSFILNWQAVSIMFVLSLLISYSTAFPKPLDKVFKPMAHIVSAGRFNGFVGMPLVFMAMFHNPHWVKVSLLVFGMGVFTVLSVTGMIKNIPKEAFDHSRTLRMGEWRVFWEVVVLGTFDQVLDIMRINIAMGWMMLPMVEGMYKFEGGVGALMEVNAKQFEMAAVFAVLFAVLIVGLIQDKLISILKNLLCPYSNLGLEKR